MRCVKADALEFLIREAERKFRETYNKLSSIMEGGDGVDSDAMYSIVSSLNTLHAQIKAFKAVRSYSFNYLASK